MLANGSPGMNSRASASWSFGMLQRDPQLAGVQLDEPAGPFQAFLAGRGRPTASRCQPCARDESTGSPVVISSPITSARLRQPFQLRRRVDAVLGVVELLRTDHAEPVFEVAEGVARAEDVDPGRDLDRPGQPLVEVQPRLVPLRDLQRLHPPDGKDGHVPFLAGQPVDEANRGAVRGSVTLDLLGQRQQVTAGPLATIGSRRGRSGGAMPSATER